MGKKTSFFSRSFWRKKLRSILSLFPPFFFNNCTETVHLTATNYLQPEKVYILPDDLHEISGMTAVDTGTVACVEDEAGVVFFYDLQTSAITRRMEFDGAGDFEGIARVGADYYILRSDGRISKIQVDGAGQPVVTTLESNVPAADSEGLGYDERLNRLLIAPKTGFTDKDFEKENRPIYALDLATGQGASQPAAVISVGAVQQLLEKEGIQLARRKKNNAVKFRFTISDIAVHPQRDEYYLLVSSEQLLLVTDRQGHPLRAFALDEKTFPQPEGIAFLPDHTLVISTEGVKGKPVIAVFGKL